jgi:hypothetical protein
VPAAPKRHLTRFNCYVSAFGRLDMEGLTDAETAPPFPGVRSWPYSVAFDQPSSAMKWGIIPVLLVPEPRPTKNPTTSTAASGARACNVHPRAVAPSKKHLPISWDSK